MIDSKTIRARLQSHVHPSLEKLQSTDAELRRVKSQVYQAEMHALTASAGASLAAKATAEFQPLQEDLRTKLAPFRGSERMTWPEDPLYRKGGSARDERMAAVREMRQAMKENPDEALTALRAARGEDSVLAWLAVDTAPLPLQPWADKLRSTFPAADLVEKREQVRREMDPTAAAGRDALIVAGREAVEEVNRLAAEISQWDPMVKGGYSKPEDAVDGVTKSLNQWLPPVTLRSLLASHAPDAGNTD